MDAGRIFLSRLIGFEEFVLKFDYLVEFHVVSVCLFVVELELFAIFKVILIFKFQSELLLQSKLGHATANSLFLSVHSGILFKLVYDVRFDQLKMVVDSFFNIIDSFHQDELVCLNFITCYAVYVAQFMENTPQWVFTLRVSQFRAYYLIPEKYAAKILQFPFGAVVKFLEILRSELVVDVLTVIRPLHTFLGESFPLKLVRS